VLKDITALKVVATRVAAVSGEMGRWGDGEMGGKK
jgi:hypothetical protein